jgi:serine/threonine protein phosphatase PrpC
LHEIHDTKDSSVLVAGVMDGHGGVEASTLVAKEMPNLLSNELLVNRRSVVDALKEAWDTACQIYQAQCTDPEYCRADYDPRQGILMANTGGEDLIPGTTISVMALDETTSKLTVLNCGDSRSFVATSTGKIRFVTRDHAPQSEEERLQEGVDAGLDYSLPQCRISKWSLSVGAYEYSVARSLEGPFATSKGIVSDPDVSEISVNAGEILLSATDGLWEVMDSNEVALDLHKMREQGMSARDAARSLCTTALNKGSSDNVSVVVVYL